MLASPARGFINKSINALDAIFVTASWGVGAVVSVGVGVSVGDGVGSGVLVPVGARVGVDVDVDVGEGEPGRFVGVGRIVGVDLGNGVSVTESAAANSAVGAGAIFDDKISQGITPQ